MPSSNVSKRSVRPGSTLTNPTLSSNLKERPFSPTNVTSTTPTAIYNQINDVNESRSLKKARATYSKNNEQKVENIAK